MANEWIIGQASKGFDVVEADTVMEAFEKWWKKHAGHGFAWPEAIQISPRQGQF